MSSYIEGLARLMASSKLRRCSPDLSEPPLGEALVGARGPARCERAHGDSCAFDFTAAGEAFTAAASEKLPFERAVDDAEFAWRWLFPLDSDICVLSLSMLVANLFAISYVLGVLDRPRLNSARRMLRRFVASFEPTELDSPALEDIVHYLLQLGCAAYAAPMSPVSDS